MSRKDWDEVKKLAADLQEAQDCVSSLKLSERNCVEIITKLIESKTLEVIFTTDGKEYVTPQHLATEMKNELYDHGGRINLVDLAKILKVDLSPIAKIASNLEEEDEDLQIILGQLIDKSYLAKISEEINEKLTAQGFVNVADLTLYYGLPGDFLQSLIEKSLEISIFALQDSQDSRLFYTKSFIEKNKNQVKEALGALTKPTPMSVIVNDCGLSEKMFFVIFDELHKMKEVPGTLTGEQGTNGVYVPSAYAKNQSEWVDSFYKQNGYLEYDAISRLGISSPENFIKRHFPNENLTFLDSVAVGPAIIDQVDANVEETAATSNFLDIYPLLPSIFDPKDVNILLTESTTRTKLPVRILNSTVIVSETFLENLQKKLENFSQSRAEEVVSNGSWLQKLTEKKLKMKNVETDAKSDRKSERRRKANTGKAGGGSQGRETKTKATKKKYLNQKTQELDSEDEDANHGSGKADMIITLENVKNELSKDMALAENEEFLEELGSLLQPVLNKHALSVAEQMLQKSGSSNLAEVEEKLNAIAANIRLFDKGIKHFDKDGQAPFVKYLMKSLATDFTVEIFKLAAVQNSMQCLNSMGVEVRAKVLLELPMDVKEPLTNLHKSLTAATLDDFFAALEPAMSVCCLVLRKFDKKKERPMTLAHREALLEQINKAQDPAVLLHLVTNVLFTAATQSALHMSGRHVSSVLKFLLTHLEPETNTALAEYHDLVLKLLSSSDETEKTETGEALNERSQEIKKIALEHKKHMNSNKAIEG